MWSSGSAFRICFLCLLVVSSAVSSSVSNFMGEQDGCRDSTPPILSAADRALVFVPEAMALMEIHGCNRHHSQGVKGSKKLA